MVIDAPSPADIPEDPILAETHYFQASNTPNHVAMTTPFLYLQCADFEADHSSCSESEVGVALTGLHSLHCPTPSLSG